jgi:(R,R)-butanediol dehydrogenase/meso-butanediol dehydrogenase/diacetyl reductase
MSGIRCGENAAVLGAGVIGLGVISWLKNIGAGNIIVIEISKKRGELALKLGADYVFNPLEEPDLGEKVRELTDGEGVEVAFECSGNPAAFKSAIGIIKRGGQVLLTGMIDREVPIIPSELVFNEWRIQGSLCYHVDEFPLVIKALAKGILPTEDIITSKIKLDDIVDSFKSLLKPDNNDIKVLVEPSE